MSLPPAPKHISDHPTAGSVIDPVNKDLQAADIDRKLRLYGVIQAFREGRMPTNAQIDETLSYVEANSPVDLSKLSPDGKKLIQDSRDIIETARQMVREKNRDELLQQFVWHTRDVDVDRAKKDPNEVLPVDADKAKADGQQAIKHLRTLLTLVLTNAEARKLVADFSLIGRDLLARGASKAAGALAPDPERLARVDDAAPPDQFHTAGGRTIGPNEGTPVLEARVPGTDTTVAHHPRADEPTLRSGDGTVRTGGQAMADARQAGQDALAQGQSHIDDVTDATHGVPETDSEKEAGKRTMMDKMRGFRDNLVDRVPDEHKERARAQRDRTKEFFTEEYFPVERRDQFIYRLKKVIIECQKHKDYQESITWLLGYMEEYAGHGQTIAGHAKDSHNQLQQDSALNTAGRELKTLLERFANGQSVDIIWQAINDLITDSRNDPELRAWFSNIDAYVRQVLLEPGFIIAPVCNSRANELRESGRAFYDGKYKAQFDNLFNSTGTFFRAMADDPLNQRFGEDWARLTRDLLFDNEGSLKFKPDLWMDIRKVILPTLIDKIGYVPIPRIEYTDDAMDLVIENLTLSGRNLFPNVVSFEAHNFVKFSPYAAIKDESHHDFTLHLGQIQADMRDVAFWFRRKQGFPKLSDSGLADVVIGGGGMSATVHLAGAGADTSSVFHVKSVAVKLDTLKFSIRDSKHDTLYNVLKPLATGLVKKQIQKAIQDALRTGLEYVDGQLVGVRDRMQEANGADETSRAQVLASIFKRKTAEASSIKTDSASKFHVGVGTKEHMLIPEHGHKDGWAQRADERAAAARSGEEWRSDAFSIVGNGAATGTGTVSSRTSVSAPGSGTGTTRTGAASAAGTGTGTGNGTARAGAASAVGTGATTGYGAAGTGTGTTRAGAAPAAGTGATGYGAAPGSTGYGTTPGADVTTTTGTGPGTTTGTGPTGTR